MKHFLLILSISLLIAGCKTTKRIAQTETRTEQTAVVDRSAQITEKAKTQADKKVVEETTETTVEYYPPVVNSSVIIDSVQSGIPEKGPVKSVTTRTTTRKEIDQGTVETEKIGNEQTKATTTAIVKEETKEKVKSKPNRWPWILGALVFTSGLIFYFRNSPVILWIRKIFGFLLRGNG